MPCPLAPPSYDTATSRIVGDMWRLGHQGGRLGQAEKPGKFAGMASPEQPDSTRPWSNCD